MTRDLINNITKPNLTGGQTPCEAGLHFLRFAAILLLLLVVRVSGVKAQTDYSGTYYIASGDTRGGNNISDIHYSSKTPANNFYLCPTDEENWICYVDPDNYTNPAEDNDQPFLTTYKYRATEDATPAIWIFEKVTGTEYYRIKHKNTSRYLTYNGKINSTSGRGVNRLRFHLQSTATNNSLFQIVQDDDVPTAVNIIAVAAIDTYMYDKQNAKYLNLSSADHNSLTGTSGKTDGPTNYTNVGATIGIWYDTGRSSEWFLEEVVPRPTITNTNSNIVFSHSEEGTTIYYTTDDTNPTTTNYAGKGAAPLQIDMPENAVTVKAIATIDNLPSCISKIRVVPAANITLAATEYTYTGSAITPEVSVKDGDTPIDANEYTVSYNNKTNAGTATVNIVDKAGGAYIVYGSTTFNITPKEATLEWSGTVFQYNKTAQKPTATVSNLIAGDECTVTVTVPEGDGINLGQYTATATALSNTNYALPADTTQTFNIVQKEVTISGITASNKVYDKTTSATLVYTGVTFGGLLEGDALTVTATGVFEDANAGTGKTVNISALTLGGTSIDNYKLAETGQQTTTTADITKKDVTVANGITANNKVYDGTATATFVCSAAVVEGVLEGDELTVTAATGTFNNKNVATGKTVTITNFTLGGTSAGNYKVAATGNQSYSTANITQLEAVLAWGNATLPYNATPQVPIVTVTNAVEGDDVTVTVTGAQTNVGENYEATASALSDANYILPTEGLTRTFSIAPATLTITADAKSKTYGDADPALTYTSSGLLGGDAVTGALTRNEGESAGTYAITQGTLTAGGNYTISYTGANLTINSKTLTITAEAKSKTYGEADPELTYTSEGLINDDAITGSLTREAGENAGDYAILQGDLTAGNNYAIAYTGANLTITKVGLTITANNNTITYGDAPAGNGITCEGFVNSETASVLSGTVGYDFSYKKFDNVGNAYSITPKGLTSSNYDITFVAGTLTVNAKEVGIDWANIAFDYDGEEHSPTATATGMVNGDLIGITVTGAQTNAGNHTATASALTGDKAGNYVLPEANTQSFTISSKSIGNGTNPADGISFDFGEGNTILLTDNTIGSTLVAPTDYTVGDDTSNSDKYSQRTVTGAGNYSGSFNVRNAKVSLTTDASEEGWSATFAAEKSDESDIGHALPEGVQAFIITGIKGEWAIPEQLDYIPEGVPVLLVASKKLNGFVPKAAESGKVTLVTDTQKGNNMLEEVTESTPNYNAGTQSAPFTTKQIYLLYNNEFVFNKAGNLKKGKVYLNPNHTVPASPSPAPARLQIAWHQTTGIKDGRWIMEDGRSEHWYTLDGRRLNGKPSAKGLYIVNGKKTVVK